MLCTIQSKYILLTASFHAQKKRLLFYLNDELVFDLVAALDNDQPDYVFPVNMERFMGQTLRVECEPRADLRFDQTDTPVLDYAGKYRPLIHFTARRGWINDPNGLVYTNGRYLMYFQHNPAATTWENMHWGFAESTDLIHWQEHDDVLFPDRSGTIFSGSGLADSENRSGLREGSEDPLLFFFTCAGDTSRASEGQPFTQNLAWSLDGGHTLIRRGEPLIPQLAPGNRDPKVIRFGDGYVMAMYLEGHEFALMRSQDLIHWDEVQRLSLPDDAECPDFYPLAADGDSSRVRWVFTAASDRYLIGTFDGSRFVPESEQLRLNWGNASYAAQSWSDTGDRRIRTAFVNTVIPGMPFGCCMDVPQEMSLRTVNGSLRLCAEPVKELASLITGTAEVHDTRVTREQPLRHRVSSKACDVTVTLDADAAWQLSLFGLEVSYDPAQKLLTSGECTAPVTGENGQITLRILYDTLCAELFAERGSVYMGLTCVQDPMLNELTVTSEDALVRELRVSELRAYHGFA